MTRMAGIIGRGEDTNGGHEWHELLEGGGYEWRARMAGIRGINELRHEVYEQPSRMVQPSLLLFLSLCFFGHAPQRCGGEIV
jgi:hypothetical protein